MNSKLDKIFSILHFIFSDKKCASILAIFLLLVVSILDGLSITSMLPLLNFILNRNELNLASGKVNIIIFSLLENIHISPNLISISVLIFLLFIIKTFGKLGTRWYIVHIQNKYEDSLIKRLFKVSLDADIKFHNKNNQGTYINAFTEETTHTSMVILLIFDTASVFLTVIIYIVISMFISSFLTLIAVGASVIFMVPLQLITKLAYQYGKKTGTDRHYLVNYLLEIKYGIKFVKSLGNKLNIINSRFKVLCNNLYSSRFKMYFFSNSLSLWGEPLGIAIILMVVFIGLNILNLKVANLSIFLIIYIRLVPMVNNLLTKMGEIGVRLPAVNRIQQYLREAGESTEQKGKILFDNKEFKIEFDSVDFGYEGKYILNKVNFIIEENECIFVSGQSGAGKTTILDLIMGFYLPSSGQILINGYSLADLDIQYWRSQIAYVQQEGFLFSDSILRNICLRLDQENVEQGRYAASLVEADKFVEARPEKYQTLLGERGVNLSGGQRQRIALARALTPLPRILILDEPTNALDKESEENIFKYITQLKGKTTIIIVAHNKDIIKEADKVLEVHNGCVKTIYNTACVNG